MPRRSPEPLLDGAPWMLEPLPAVRLAAIGRRFHDDVMGTEGEHLVYRDAEEAQRFRARLRRWPAELLRGPRDEAYWGERRETAAHYARLGLPHGQVFNVTYHRTREAQKLRSLQDVIVTNMPVTVLCLDAAGVVTAATRPSARLFGEQARPGQRFDAFLPRELVEAADLPSHIGRALATGREAVISRIQLGRPPDTRHLRIHVLPLEHPLAQVLLHVEELTDVVQAEARAQQAEALARVGALAANVAHEIRNPLAAISLTLQVIGRSLEPGDRRLAVLGRVEEQVKRLDRLVTDLLDYARPPQPKIAPVDLVRIAEDSVAASGVRAHLLIRDPVPALADPQLLLAALVNLLQNARDAAGEHGIVEVRVGPWAELLVVDDGPGIGPELRERLFTPFVTTKARGTGLGLAISRKLVEAQGGSLLLDETQVLRMHGRAPGASFRIRLPPAPARASPADSAARSG